jgi:hypothetical protein
MRRRRAGEARPAPLIVDLGYGAPVDGVTSTRRRVATALLVVALAVFALATPAHADVPAGSPGAIVVGTVVGTADLAATTPQAPTPQHNAPGLPMAAADATADRTPPTARATGRPGTAGARPPAHRQPAAGRAPPARQVDL